MVVKLKAIGFSTKKWKWWSPAAWGSALIRHCTKWEYSHSFALLEDDHGFKWVLESTYPHGIRLWDLDTWLETHAEDNKIDFGLMNEDQDIVECSWLYIVGLTRVKYDLLSVIFIYPFYLLTGKWLGSGKNQGKKLYCSEMVAHMLQLDKPYKWTPKMIKEHFNLLH